MAQYTPGSFVHYRPSGSSGQPLWPAVVCTDDVAPDGTIRPPGYVTLVLRIGESLSLHWAFTTELQDYNPFYCEEDTVATNTPGLGEAYAIANSALEAGLGLDYWRTQLRDTTTTTTTTVIVSDSDEEDADLQRAIRESRGYSNPTSSPLWDASSPARDMLATDAVPKSSKFALASSSNDLLNWNRLRGGHSAPTSDVVEGELAASKGFVLMYVGPDSEERTLQRSHVWDRPYFQDQRTGIMHFELKEGQWLLSHPRLAEIDPEDFDLVAEWLESGQLGHKHPEGEEEVQEAFAQNISAWETALKLGMTDLLDHIVDKLERLAPWDMWDIMAFACHVFEETPGGSCLPVQERMKDLLATELAQNFWIYIEDEHLSAGFIQRLKDLPELERDIYERRTAAINARLHAEGNEGDEEDEVEDEMDMN